MVFHTGDIVRIINADVSKEVIGHTAVVEYISRERDKAKLNILSNDGLLESGYWKPEYLELETDPERLKLCSTLGI